MNNKILITILGMFLLTGFVIAGVGLVPTNSNIELTKTEKDALESIGITNPTRSSETCYDEICLIYLDDEGYNKKPIKINRYECPTGYINETTAKYICPEKIYLTVEQREAIYDEAIERTLKETANATLQRQSNEAVVEISGGTITVSEE